MSALAAYHSFNFLLEIPYGLAFQMLQKVGHDDSSCQNQSLARLQLFIYSTRVTSENIATTLH